MYYIIQGPPENRNMRTCVSGQICVIADVEENSPLRNFRKVALCQRIDRCVSSMIDGFGSADGATSPSICPPPACCCVSPGDR